MTAVLQFPVLSAAANIFVAFFRHAPNGYIGRYGRLPTRGCGDESGLGIRLAPSVALPDDAGGIEDEPGSN
jgi:hypothetical protein